MRWSFHPPNGRRVPENEEGRLGRAAQENPAAYAFFARPEAYHQPEAHAETKEDTMRTPSSNSSVGVKPLLAGGRQ
jgi:hypothetical protein